MIHTVYSNSYEVLQTVLLHNIEALGVSDADALEGEALFEAAFRRVPVIVPSMAVRNDLARAVARRDGVCSGLDFQLLAEWMGFFAKEPLANVVGSEAGWMIWRILKDNGPQSFRRAPGHERLCAYLEGKNDLEIHTLAVHIADMFLVYSGYRTDWLFEWLELHPELVPQGPEHAAEMRALLAHPDFAWQKDLWLRLKDSPSWQGCSFLDNFAENLRKLSESQGSRELLLSGRRVVLPEVLHIFAPAVVPPLMLPLLKAYALSGREVWFYLLNPSSGYWFDLVPRYLISGSASQQADDHRESGHPLLADNARSTRANIDRLWRFTAAGGSVPLSETDLPPVEEAGTPWVCRRDSWETFTARFAGRPQDLQVDTEVASQSYYLEAREPVLLRRIQDSVLNLNPDLRETADGAPLFTPEDRSVEFVRAPTLTRELESLADLLLDAFAKDKTLSADDVLVVTPDLPAAAPLIEKVFGSLPPERRLAWEFRGLRRIDTDTPSQAVLALMHLMTGRATADEFESWLSLPLVAARFGLTADDMTLAAGWLREAGYACGLSDAHLEAIDPVTFARARDMSLARAAERLTLGFLLPDGAEDPAGDLLPVAGDSRPWKTAAAAPDTFRALLQISDALETFRLRTMQPATPDVWTAWLSDALQVFFPTDLRTADFGPVRRAADDLRAEIERAGGEEGDVPAVPFALFASALGARMESRSGGGSGAGRITFAPMPEMRSIPYRWIVCIGLNDDCAFPGTGRREEFDLMARVPRRGDRDSRIDNRNTFLDLLLAARERFVVSYSVGTGADAAGREPSVVAQELRDWLLSFAPGKDARKAAEKLLTRTVPLNAWSKANFMADPLGFRSHDPKMLEAVCRAREAGYAADPEPFADTGVDFGAGAGQELTPDDVAHYWRHASQEVLKRLGVRLDSAEEQAVPDPLMPSANALVAWGRETAMAKQFAAVFLTEDRDPASLPAALDRVEDQVRLRIECDTRAGALGVRDWACDEDIAFARKLAENAAPLYLASTPVREQLTVRVTLPCGVTLAQRYEDLREQDGGRLAVRISASKNDSFSHLRTLIGHAVVAAAGEPVRTVLVCRNKDKKNKAPKKGEPVVDTSVLTVTFPAMTPDTATRFLEALVLPMTLSAEGPVPFTDEEKFGAVGPTENDRTLWRGQSVGTFSKATGELHERLKEVLLADTAEKQTTMIEAFVRETRSRFLPAGDTADNGEE